VSWEAVDRYFAEALVPPLFEEAAGGAAVSALQGRLLEVLARAVGARRVLEIGTLEGYSTAWLARAVAPDGRVITLEASPEHARPRRPTWPRSKTPSP
jgi:predicted O-methyltransferase YrrM